MNFKQALIAHLQGDRVQKRIPGAAAWDEFICLGDRTLLAEAMQDGFASNCEFRLAPRTIRVNGVEVPAPEREALKNGDLVYLPSLDAEDLHICAQWFGCKREHEYLKRGLVYLNKEDAIARAKAMLLTQE
jgi:hypothetical protein